MAAAAKTFLLFIIIIIVIIINFSTKNLQHKSKNASLYVGVEKVELEMGKKTMIEQCN